MRSVKFSSTDTVKHPRDRVYEVYRDRLPAIGAACPDLERIEACVYPISARWASSAGPPCGVLDGSHFNLY